MEGIEHKMISVNGINMHIAEKGKGPMVLFLHGFPELWYSWRHQILYMAAQGYRAVAPDLRGYGDTTGPPVNDFTKFTILHVLGDIMALLDKIAPDEDKVFVVGHDWGAYIAWHLCLFRPDRVKAMVNLSVHFLPRSPTMNFVDIFRGLYGDDHYIYRFQVPGEIEAEFAQIGVRKVVKKFLTYRDPAPFLFPKGKGFGDGNSPDTQVILPSWLSEEDVDYYTSKFEKNGFTGGINYYRVIHQNWELTAPWTGSQVKVPVKFVVGDLDLVYNIPGAKEYIHNGEFKKDVPLLDEVVVMEGVAHFLNQEKPEEINKHILEFIKKF
ncbi:Epoxide hydrolase A [Camellia lanceoleosa]|uniref:Epoxide hydrolase A n=1 Tax=Camellia lanceoleosa TaxID=1840588 RepID=A0ACC0HGM4_9ERIC|nr:Epoxide hydrolase A [Camellia lanceoleosa]